MSVVQQARDSMPVNCRRGVAYHAPIEVEGMILSGSPALIRWNGQTYAVRSATLHPVDSNGWWKNDRDRWNVQTDGGLDLEIYRTSDGRWFLERVW